MPDFDQCDHLGPNLFKPAQTAPAEWLEKTAAPRVQTGAAAMAAPPTDLIPRLLYARLLDLLRRPEACVAMSQAGSKQSPRRRRTVAGASILPSLSGGAYMQPDRLSPARSWRRMARWARRRRSSRRRGSCWGLLSASRRKWKHRKSKRQSDQSAPHRSPPPAGASLLAERRETPVVLAHAQPFLRLREPPRMSTYDPLNSARVAAWKAAACNSLKI
jgi:hypothetical protein